METWNNSFSDKEYRRIAKLDNGELVKYDAAALAKDAYSPDFFECIGHGVIHSINEVEQIGRDQLYFFKRKTVKPEQ